MATNIWNCHLYEGRQYSLNRCARLLAVDVIEREQHPVARKEFWVGPARGVARCTDLDRLQHTAGSQLLDGAPGVHLEGGFAVVRFNAPDVMRDRAVESVHQLRERLAELKGEGTPASVNYDLHAY